MRRVKKRGGHRMKALGRKCLTVWFDAAQWNVLTKAAELRGSKRAAFARLATMAKATEVVTDPDDS